MSLPAAAPDHLKDTLEEMRASAAARGSRKGLARAIEKAMLRLLELLLALLADFRAGRLTPRRRRLAGTRRAARAARSVWLLTPQPPSPARGGGSRANRTAAADSPDCAVERAKGRTARAMAERLWLRGRIRRWNRATAAPVRDPPAGRARPVPEMVARIPRLWLWWRETRGVRRALPPGKWEAPGIRRPFPPCENGQIQKIGFCGAGIRATASFQHENDLPCRGSERKMVLNFWPTGKDRVPAFAG